MRRWWPISVIVVLALAAVVAWRLRAPEVLPPQLGEVAETPQFTAVDVRASGTQQAYSLTGVVKDPTGAPVPNAEVFLAASSQVSVTNVRCGICNEWLLGCHAHESARSVATLLEKRQGELTPAMTTRSDGEGRFRFEQLSGISFTVWGRAPGFGFGIKERAAPGDPVELFLPAPRTLVGQLRSEKGEPVAGTVRVTSRRLAQVLETQAGPDGAFTLEGLGEGPFAVSAVSPGLLPTLDREAEAGGVPLSLVLSAPRRLEVKVLRDGQPIDALLTLQGDHLTRQLPVKNGFVAVDGLYPSELFATAVAGELSSVPTRVTLASAVTTLTLVVDRAGTIAVTVLDEADQPVTKPTLELLTRGGELVSKRALNTGELAMLGPLGVGEYQLRASASGYQSALVPVQVKPGETPLEVTLTRGTLIAGKIVDEYGRPAAGVSVLVSPMGDSIIADADGHFVAVVPSPGLYELHAHHSDWGGVDQKVTAPKEDVVLQLEPRAGVEITASADGRRLEGASVTLFHSQGNFRNDRTSGADGVVLMRGLPADTYIVVASHPDYLSSERMTLTLRDGDLQKISLELKAGGALEGVVVDTTGVPVSGISVSTSPRASEPRTTDGQGHFRLTPLRKGTRQSVRAQGKGYEQTERVMGQVDGEPVRVVVKRLPMFRGRVLGDGAPLKNFRVDEHEVTSTDGRFELPLPATEDKVIVAIEAPGYEPMMADRPNTPDLGDFDLKRAEMVTGVVRDSGGQAVVDAVVTCESCEQSVLTDANGHFTIGKPAFQREFTLLAKKGRRTGSKPVKGALQGVEITLSAGVKLTGLAYLPNGQVAAGLEIAGINIDRGETVSAVTNEQGTYELEVSPGTYRFMLVLAPGVSGSEDPPALITSITGPTRLDFGPVPGLATLTVRVSPKEGYALWLVRGELPTLGNPPMELLHADWAQLVYQPHGERVVLGALAPGRYTLVWSSFHASVPGGPIVAPVQIPAGGEVSLVR